MRKIFGKTLVAAFAAAACAAATGASAAPGPGVTQDLSARTCRTVVTHTWRYGHRVAVKRTSCSPSYGYRAYHSYAYAPGCRYVFKTRWHDGRRISVRTRVCG
jgi:hypothetical protein